MYALGKGIAAHFDKYFWSSDMCAGYTTVEDAGLCIRGERSRRLVYGTRTNVYFQAYLSDWK